MADVVQPDPYAEAGRRQDSMKKQQEKWLYQTAANGMTVRIPAENYGTWKQGQQNKGSSNSKELAEELRQLLKK